MAAQLITVRLSRGDMQPWGFRLQGGADFGTPLLVQKINGGSLADQAGLIPGDAVIQINDMDVFALRHKDAQDIVVRSGNTFTMTVQRGGSTWRPHVQVTGALPSPGSYGQVPTVTRTSLAHKHPQPVEHIGCGYNNSARPFGGLNGSDGHIKSIVNKQYNTPVGIYSEEAIAETLSAQAEVLAGGVLGVNFKKNEKEYNPSKSEVLKFLKEAEHEPHDPEPYAPANFYWTASHAIGRASPRGLPKMTGSNKPDDRVGTPLQQNTLAPDASHRPSLPATQNAPDGNTCLPQNVCPLPQLTDAQNEKPLSQVPEEQKNEASNVGRSSGSGIPLCGLCGASIVGVFCRIKDKNLHVECFKCATCGTPLKNQGYYNYNNKLYCDIHAKMAALQNPPPGTEGYVPIPIRPTPKLTGNVIANALNAHGYKIQTNGASPGVLTGAASAQSNNKNSCETESDKNTLTNSVANCNPIVNHQQNTTSTTHSRTNSSSSSSTTNSSSCGLNTHNNNIPIGNSLCSSNDSPLSQSSNCLSEKLTPSHSRNSSFEKNIDEFNQFQTLLNNSNIDTSIKAPATTIGVAQQQQQQQLVQNNYHKTSSTHHQIQSDKTNINNNFTDEADKSIDLVVKHFDLNEINKLNTNTINFDQQLNNSSTALNPNNVYNQFLNQYSKKVSTSKLPLEDSESSELNSILELQKQEKEDTSDMSTVRDGKISPFPTIPFPAEPIQFEKSTSTNLKSADGKVSPYPTIPLPEDSGYGTVSPFPTIPPPLDSQMEYVTIQGNVIRSVIPPGKGVSVDYSKVNQGYGAPRPFNQGPMSPQAGGQRSPGSSYPSQQQQQWNQQAQNPYATLPRTGGQGRYHKTQNTYNTSYNSNNVYNKPQPILNNYAGGEKQMQESKNVDLPEKNQHPDYFEDQEVVQTNNTPGSLSFAWPPKDEQKDNVPTAAPLYIPPPETQHIIARPIKERLDQNQTELVNQQHHGLEEKIALQKAQQEAQLQAQQQAQQEAQEQAEQLAQQQAQQLDQQQAQQQAQWQSRSAPELTSGRQHIELESSSDSYTSTCTTTTTTSEEYNRMYQAQVKAYQMQQMYDQSGSEIDYHMDMEVASVHQQQENNDFCSSSSDYINFQSGRRSGQGIEGFSGRLSTTQLVDMVRVVTPSPTPMNKPGRRVEFSDDIKINAHLSEETLPTELDEKHDNEFEEPVEEPICIAKVVQKVQDEQKQAKVVEEANEQFEKRFLPTPEIPINIPEVKRIPPSNIPNPIPKQWINPMVRALTTAPEKPVEIHPSLAFCTNTQEYEEACAYITETKEEIVENNIGKTIEEIQPGEPIVLKETPLKGSFMTHVMAVAPTDRYSFLPPSNEPIPLPEETEPYMPPPIDMKPYIREDFRPKSPFLSALITAPETSYTPFGHDVCSQLLDLPTPKEPLTMTQALETAPERPISPLNSDNIMKLKLDNQKKPDYILLSREEQNTITETKIHNERIEKIDKKISAFVASSPKSQQSLSTLPKEGYPDVQMSCATPRNSLDFIQSDPFALSLLSSSAEQSCTCSKQKLQSIAPLTCTQSNKRTMQNFIQSEVQQQQQQNQNNTSSVQGNSIASLNTVSDKKKIETNANANVNAKADTNNQNVAFPPSPGLSAKKAVLSGLHKPDNIPQYQRNWTVLQSQHPVRTPEPEDLKQNVPLAFVAPTNERSPSPNPETSLKQPHHLLRGVSPTSAFAGSPLIIPKTANETSSKKINPPKAVPQTKSTNVPLIVEERVGPITMSFQSLDDIPDGRSSQASFSRSYTPSLMNKPAPIIPPYQTTEKLVFEECSSVEARPYDRRSASPFPDRCKSPAPGPPPNPLKAIAIHAPRVKESGPTLTVPRTPQAGSITTGQSYLGQHQQQQQELINNGNSQNLPPPPPPEFLKQSLIDPPSKSIYGTINPKTIPCKENNGEATRKQHPNYLPGQATKMLANSLDKISMDPKMMAEAGKIVSNLLESRITNNNNIAPTKLHSPSFNRTLGVSNQIAVSYDLSQKLPEQHPMKKILEICDSNPSERNNEEKAKKIVKNKLDETLNNEKQIDRDRNNMNRFQNIESNSTENVNHDSLDNTNKELKPLETVTYRNKDQNKQMTSRQDRISYIDKMDNLLDKFESDESKNIKNECENKTTEDVVSKFENGKLPICCQCNIEIKRGPFITALGRIWCPEHFVCVNGNCRRSLQDIGFVEEKGDLYCEYCFEKFLAPTCSKCNSKIKGDCLNAIGKHFHPECFICAYCGKLFGNTPFFLEDGEPYCEADWNELFTTKCYACGFPVEAGDRWVEALNHNYHSQCFNCTMCKKNLEGTSFYNKGGRPFCKNHAR